MKPPATVLLTAIFIFLSLNVKSQKSKEKYTDFKHGQYFLYYNKWDSAFLMFNRYVNEPDDTLNKGKAYSYMGEIQWKTGNLYEAQENLMNAVHTLDSLNKNHREEIGDIYNLLGNVSLDLKLYNEAIGFYNSAIGFTKLHDNILEYMNGKATALQKKGNYSDAIAIYDSILYLKPNNQKIVARVIDNRARTKWLQNPAYAVLPELQSALNIRIDSQYNTDVNASYAHLSDYYAGSKSDSALFYANKMLENSRESQSSNDMLEAIDKLVMLNNSPALKEHWYEEYKILNDSIDFSRDTTRSRFASIRYDFQKSKADNLVLHQHVTNQRLGIFALSAVAIIIIILLSLRYNKRRKRMREESENAIRNSRLKTSQKIHDVVANGLYVIMNELEHVKEIEKEPLINRIEGLYEKSRDISYEDAALDNSPDYQNQIHDLLISFANDQTKVITAGNVPTFWDRVTGLQKHELKLTLKEIMVNMRKHSHAENVVVVFKQEKNKGIIQYQDDGIGFNDDQKFGKGLSGTVTRIKSLNGDVSFGKSGSGGASIAISFPLQSDKT